jgi:2-dehydro-3-deoxyphosphogluconate aldolase/(4S)-4-hydroxy-2-oxoglutarate aldolase
MLLCCQLFLFFHNKTMESRLPETILERLYRCGVIACMTIENPLHSVSAARALIVGGIDVMELTLRTPKSIESLRRITAEVPEMLAGVGTILTPQQVKESIAAGGHFGVAPGISERVVKAAQDAGLPFAPGIATPSELEKGLELGCREMKFFPAEPSGGITYMKSMYTPYAHLGVRFLPLGGVNIRNIGDYIREPATLAVGGSWIVTSDLLRTENWQAITTAAKTAISLVQEIRQVAIEPFGRAS